MAGEDSKIGVWELSTVAGQDYWCAPDALGRLPTADPPSTPTGLAATPGSTTAAFTWDAVTGATTISLELRDNTAMGDWIVVSSTIPGNSTSFNDSDLTPENNYSVRIRATNSNGTSDYSSVVNFDTTAASSGNTRIFFEDFEGTLQTGSTLSHGAQVVETGTSFSGTKCVRINQKTGVSDPLGPTGDNRQTYEYQGSVLTVLPEILTFQWRVKIDDYWQKGTNFNNTGSDTIYMNSKGGYMGPIGNTSSQGFFPVFHGGPTGSINLGANFPPTWVNEPWVNQAGRVTWYLNTGVPFGTNGNWNKWTVVIDNTHPDYRQLRMYMNENLATNATYAPDGIIRLPKEWTPQTFSTSYISSNATDLSEDRTGTACGWQFDEIEIWDGVPAWLEE